MTRILVVCLGNICRSPTAEGVLRRMGEEAGLDLDLDSAGTGNWHLGKPPYAPAIRAAAARGYDLEPLRARQVSRDDFRRFDLILAMDRDNLRDLSAIAPKDATAELRLFVEDTEVPDPYFTGDFDSALDLIEDGARRLVDHLRQKDSAVRPKLR